MNVLHFRSDIYIASNYLLFPQNFSALTLLDFCHHWNFFNTIISVDTICMRVSRPYFQASRLHFTMLYPWFWCISLVHSAHRQQLLVRLLYVVKQLVVALNDQLGKLHRFLFQFSLGMFTHLNIQKSSSYLLLFYVNLLIVLNQQ